MRKLYTLILAFVASMAVWAQESALPTGVNVAGQLGMKDFDSSQPWSLKGDGSVKENRTFGNYWTGQGINFLFDYITDGDNLYDGREGYTAAGFYGDGKIEDDLPELHQVLKMPAGYYTIRVQAIYRDATGQKTGECISNYLKTNSYKKNAWVYADILSSSDPNSEVVRDFSKAIRHMGSAESTENLCTWPNDDWRKDGSFKRITDEYDEETEEYVEKTFYYPSSILGASMHFKKGYYWNELDILLTEDSYVKIGLKKTDYIVEDWLCWGGWEIIFNGEPTEDVQIKFAQQEYTREKEELEALKNKIANSKFKYLNNSFVQAIASAVDDDIMTSDDAYNDAESSKSLDEYMKVIKNETRLIEYYEENLQFLGHLDFLIGKSKKLSENSEHPGLSDFIANLNAIISEINSKALFDEEDRPMEFCQAEFAKLAKARGDYLDTQEADENGAKDFTAVINHPWFVNDEYEPVYGEESGDLAWSLQEPTWQDRSALGGPGNYSSKKEDRTDIASDVTIYIDKTVKNQWYENMDFTDAHITGMVLYYQAGLVGACDGWHSNAFGSGSEQICQNVLGLPSGYYSLKALLRGNGDNWNGEYHNIFATNSLGETVTSPVGQPDSEYPNSAEYGWNEQRPYAYVEHKTGIIHVPDGQLLIGGQSSMVANYTGFRLFFYGEEPPVNNLIAEDIEEVKKAAEVLTFKGDKAYVEEQIAKCVLPIEGTAMFETYRGYLNSARTYINAATIEMKKFNAIDTYTAIVADNPAAEDMVTPALNYASKLGEGENDTYKLIDAAVKTANKYKEYINAYVDAQKYDDADIKQTLADQKAAISQKMQTVEQLTSYISDLARPIKVATLTALGAADATEASPVDVTSLIVNPTFEAGNQSQWDKGTTTGWTSTISSQTNEYSRGNVEIWNQGNGSFSQKLIGMPAGIYELSCYALYRDNTAVTADLVKAYNEAGGEENWANHNAELFVKTSLGNDFASYVKGIEALKNTTPTFTRVATAFEYDEENNNEPYETEMTTSAPEGEGEDIPSVTKWTHVALGSYPFDTQVEVDGTTYCYPASMYGFYQCWKQFPNVYLNKVRFEVKEDETIEIGLRKNVTISEDWLIFDDFQLKYLSGDIFKNRATGIVDANANQVKKGATYNLAGQKVDASYRGIVIKDGRKMIQK